MSSPYRPAYARCGFRITNHQQAEAVDRLELKAAFSALGDTVYFLRRKGLVKIGHTVHLRNRMWVLGARPTDLLYLLPGGRPVEQGMHARFAHLRASGPDLGVEHFHLEGDLLDFINECRIDMGLNSLVA